MRNSLGSVTGSSKSADGIIAIGFEVRTRCLDFDCVNEAAHGVVGGALVQVQPGSEVDWYDAGEGGDGGWEAVEESVCQKGLETGCHC